MFVAFSPSLVRELTQRQGNYNASYEAAEPDSHIVDLNTDLVQFDEMTSFYLPKTVRRYVVCPCPGIRLRDTFDAATSLPVWGA